MLRKQIILAMTVIWKSSQLSSWVYNRLYKVVSFLSPLLRCHKVYVVADHTQLGRLSEQRGTQMWTCQLFTYKYCIQTSVGCVNSNSWPIN